MPPQPQSLLQQKLGGMEGQLAALRREMELKEEHDKVLKEQVECLAEDTMKELEDKKGEVQSLTHQFDVVTKKYTILTEECEALQHELKTKMREKVSLKPENAERRLKRSQNRQEVQDLYMNTAENLDRIQNELKKKDSDLKTAKEEKRRIGRRATWQKAASQRYQNDKRALKQDKTRLIWELGNLQAVQVLQLKDPTTGHFSRDSVKCIIELIGEHQVSASRCSEVIACVSKHLLKKEIPADQLPSLRTVLRYADKGHVLSKIQLSESLLNADHYDLHTDGTTKCGKKVIGQQMTTSTGQSVACSYSLVATEDTATLLDVTTNLLHELTDVNDQTGSAADDMFRKLLGKLSATMSDRAAVNKYFNNQLNALKKACLLYTSPSPRDRLVSRMPSSA